MDNIQLEKGYTQIANELLEKLAKTSISGSSWRVLMAIIRKLYGFNKKEDWIEYSQLCEMTGLSKPKISQCIKQLSETGTVTKTSNGNKTIIGISKNYEVLPERVTLTNSGINRYQKRISTVTRKNDLHGSTKETITKETIQKKYLSLKDIKEKDLKEIAEDYNVPINFVKSELETMTNWLSAKGKTYKNYKSALRNWVKKDAIKRIDYAKKSNSKRGVDLSHL